MNTRSTAAPTHDFPFNFKAPFLAAGDASAAGQGWSQRKCISALMRLACRVLGMKRCEVMGLGLAGVATRVGASLAPAAWAQSNDALPGIFIGTRAGSPCGSISDPSSVAMAGGDGARTGGGSINFNVGNLKYQSDTKDSQRERVLFYNPSDATTGATSRTLGGELFVNGGVIGVGVAKAPISIGNNGTLATGEDSVSIGQGTKAAGPSNAGAGVDAGNRGSVAIGNEAVANNSGLAIGEGTVTSSGNSSAIESLERQVATQGRDLVRQDATSHNVTLAKGNVRKRLELSPENGFTLKSVYGRGYQLLTMAPLKAPIPEFPTVARIPIGWTANSSPPLDQASSSPH